MLGSSFRVPSRSLGLKFLLVCVLAALMMLPAGLIAEIVRDRAMRAEAVVAEVGDRSGGQQAFTGPILAAPYTVTTTPAPTQLVPNPKPEITQRGWYVVFAKSGTGAADVAVQEKARGSGGLFKVRAYEADLDFRARFDLADEPRAAPDGAQIDWGKAVMLVGVRDTRGAAAPATLVIDGASIPFEPGSAYANVLPNYGDGAGAQWLVARLGERAKPGAAFDARATLQFKGVESLNLVAFAGDTTLQMSGDWADVGFFGTLPSPEHEITQTGFTAQWTVPFIARNLAQSGDAATLGALSSLYVQTNFVDPASPYQAVTRALKYAVLFIGVVFLAYFVMEATAVDRRVHPAQYLLVGLAQLVFYLLLLSLSERIGFDIAFLLAALATVSLIGLYAGAVFKSLARGGAALAGFAALYGLIYALMRLEDYALLAGSIAAFLVIAAVMIFTRNLDWYGLDRGREAGPSSPAS